MTWSTTTFKGKRLNVFSEVITVTSLLG